MKADIDPLFEMAKGMNDISRSGSNYGKLLLINELIVMLEAKKAEIKKDIQRDSKFPDPYLDKL